MMKISHLVIDLGGVLIDLNWEQATPLLYGSMLHEEEAVRRWVDSESVFQHETGRIGAHDFYRQFAAEQGLQGDWEAVEAGARCLLGNLKADCESILQKLAKRFTLSMLSNISHVHTEQLDNQTDMKQHFSNRFLSWQLGRMKPESGIYSEISHQLSAPPQMLAFFDDRENNVVAAREHGMHAWRVDSPGEIMEIVDSHEVFS